MSTNVYDGLGDNLSGVEPLLEARAEKKPRRPAKAAEEVRVRIMLEDNEQIPPGGQFLQVDGRSFLIQAGQEVDVPLSVIDVLDHAVMSVPVTDEFHSVIGYRDRLRFPYRVITDRRSGQK